jgi:leishmanolysin
MHLLLGVLLPLILVPLTNSHCVHDKIKYTPQYANVGSDEGFLKDSNNANQRHLDEYQSIRIKADYSNMKLQDSTLDYYIRYGLMPAAINYWSQALKVKRISGALTLDANSCYQTTVPTMIRTVGVNADLILFVTANPSQDAFLAWAVACFVSKDTNRPVAGQININPNYMKATDPRKFQSQLATVMHEMVHILGFSQSLFSFYINPVTKSVLGQANVIREVTRVGQTISTIVLDKVVDRAKLYFNCPSLDGLDLEDEGDSASIGSHWERKLLFNELMTASDIPDARITEFTLALLEGSGWYTPDYTMAEPMTWGKGLGCSFINSPCIDSTSKLPAFKEFCGPAVKEGCFYGNRYRGYCGFGTGTPDEYNYWGNSTISKDMFSNGCPYFLPYSNGDCENATGIGSTILSEAFGTGSKCFQVTLAKQTVANNAFPNIQSSCYKSQCNLVSANTYELHITVGNQTVVCTDSAGDKSVSGYFGVLKCPIASDFCKLQSEKFCENACSGRGTCASDKQCVCMDGWTGKDCSQPIELPQCSRCNNSKNDLTSCYGDDCLCKGIENCKTSSAIILNFYTIFGLLVIFAYILF